MGRGYQDLRVWQRSMDLAEAIYGFIEALPHEEKWNLSDQLRRGAISVPSNIAEGHGTGTDQNFARHVGLAQGSLAELETQLLLIRRLEIAAEDVPNEVWAAIGDLNRGLQKLREYLENRG